MSFKFVFFGFVFLVSIFASYADTLKEAKKAYAGRQYQKAVKLFLEHAKKNPSDGEPYMYIGYILESQKEYDASIAYFSKAVDLKLTNKQKLTCLLKIIVYYNYHQSWNMVVHYTNRYLKIEQNPEIQKIRSKALAHKGVDSPPPNFHSHSTERETQNKGKEKNKVSEKSNSKSKEASKEKTSVEKASSKTSFSTLPSKKQKSEEELIWENVISLSKKGDFKEAEKEILLLLEKNPDNKNYLYKAGVIFYKLEKYPEALEVLKKSLALCSKTDKDLLYYNHLYLGNVYYKLEDFREAEKSFIDAFSYKFSTSALIGITRIRFESEDYKNVIALTSFLLKYEKDNPEVYLQRGISLVKLGQRKEGFEFLLKFRSLISKEFPDLSKVPEKFHDGLLYLGVFYSGRGKYKLALKYLDLVSRTRNDQISYQYALGKSYHYLREYDKSISALEKIPTVPAANYLIARFFALKKNIEQTKIYLSKAAKDKEVYWVKVRIDPIFRELINSSPEFSDFVTYRGNVPGANPKSENLN